jgi:putative FmdB family regulatory protein
MPIYAYRCASCGFAKDVLQKISDPLLTVCPECSAATFQKQLTAAGFQLKGSGWYVTDFRGGEAGKSSDGANSGVGTEAKTVVKTETKTVEASSTPTTSTVSAPVSTPTPASPAPVAKSIASAAPSTGA